MWCPFDAGLIAEDKILDCTAKLVQSRIVKRGGVVDGKTPIGGLCVHHKHVVCFMRVSRGALGNTIPELGGKFDIVILLWMFIHNIYYDTETCPFRVA